MYRDISFKYHKFYGYTKQLLFSPNIDTFLISYYDNIFDKCSKLYYFI